MCVKKIDLTRKLVVRSACQPCYSRCIDSGFIVVSFGFIYEGISVWVYCLRSKGLVSHVEASRNRHPVKLELSKSLRKALRVSTRLREVHFSWC